MSASPSTLSLRKRVRQDEQQPATSLPPASRAPPPSPPLVRNNSAPSSPSPPLRPTAASPVHSALTATPLGRTVEQRKQALLYQLSPLYIPDALPSLEEHKKTLYELLERTLTSQHNNACLLVGYSGSGKSALTRSVLHDLRRAYQPQGRSFTVVTLNGRLHGDDTAAMREVVRQLSADMEVERPPASADFHTNLAFLQTLLASSHYTHTPVFFILDAFELFAHAPPAKQTLLYNLCDLLQSSRSQLALLAHTVRIDAFDLLEKRIKSRMFGRRLLFPHLQTEAQVVAVMRDRLRLDRERVRRGLRRPGARGGAEEFDFVPGGELAEGAEGGGEAEEEWLGAKLSAEVERHNEAVERMLADEALLAAVSHHFKLGKNVRWFLTALVSRPPGLANTPGQYAPHRESDMSCVRVRGCCCLRQTYAVCQMRGDSPYPLAEHFLYAEQRPFDPEYTAASPQPPNTDTLRSSPSLLSSHFSLNPFAAATPSSSPPPVTSPVSASASSGAASPLAAHLPLPPTLMSASRPWWYTWRLYWLVMAVLVLLAVQQWIAAARSKASLR